VSRRPFADVLLGAALATAGAAQSATDMLVADYEKARAAELLASGQRHVDLGWSIRDSGLIQQATWQFVRAVEVSEGKHQGASMVLGIVRNYGEAFWKKRKKTASKASLQSYEKRAAAIERQDQKGQIELARAAQKAHLVDRAREHWLAALQMGAEIQRTDKGLRIDGVAVPQEHAAWLGDRVRTVNGAVARFEPAGTKVPASAALREAGSGSLVVRTDLPGDAAENLHALASALLPYLQERLDGAPVRPLVLFVFGARADYDAYLAAVGHRGAPGRGLCDYGSFRAFVCAEGLGPDEIHGLVLHELTHLFFFGSSPVAMPDWYAEGLAETFGGQGTFTWDGRRLVVGGTMRGERLAAVKQAPLPLRELLAARAEQQLAAGQEQGLRYYAQCQAFLRWLQQPANPYRERFLAWEDECRSAMPGVSATSRFGDAGPAAAAFDRVFARDFAAMEAAFLDWLAGQ